MEWDFADPAQRATEIDDAVSAIRRIILPFFALFEEPSSAVDILMFRRALWQPSLLEYALALFGRDAAEAAGRSYLKGNPEVRRRFEAALAKFREQGVPRFRSDLGSDLAALALVANLNFKAPAS